MGLTERRACAGAGGPPLHSVSADIDAWKTGSGDAALLSLSVARAENEILARSNTETAKKMYQFIGKDANS